ncbi:hypothetical protein OUZ56_000634 [Daphnia magna]|uniref:Uncharacterized protein n=1 Tax=Daphnia magna TaxID=35525 RepID=A0ABR0A0A2_9CRUS|nr:hypothetical protein OUZ56_000634 [Daphnia magna]
MHDEDQVLGYFTTENKDERRPDLCHFFSGSKLIKRIWKRKEVRKQYKYSDIIGNLCKVFHQGATNSM